MGLVCACLCCNTSSDDLSMACQMILVWHIRNHFLFFYYFFSLSSLFSQVTVSDYSLTMSKIAADTDKNEEEEQDEPE